MTAFLSESIPTSCLSGRDRAPWTPSQSVIAPWQLQSFAGPVQAVATTVLCVLCCVQWLCCGPEKHFTVLCLLALALGSLSWCSWAWRDMRHLFSAPWAQCRWMDSHQEAEVSALSFWSSCVYLCPQGVRITRVHHHTWFMSYLTQGYFGC